MKHSEFKRHLSSRLDIKESEVSSLLRANRKILKKLVDKDNGFAIPRLGLFKKHQILKQKEYSHYHGYKLLTRLKKILRFYPEPIVEKKVSGKSVTDSDISHLLTNSTGVSNELSEMFVNETATIIKEGLARDKQIYIAGVGLFKAGQRADNEKVKDLKGNNNVVYFRADAGLRSNILKSNKLKHKQYGFESLQTEKPVTTKAENASREFETVRQSFATLNNTMTVISEKHMSPRTPATSKKPPPVLNQRSTPLEMRPESNSTPYAGASEKTATIIPIRKTSVDEEHDKTSFHYKPYFTADRTNQSTLSRETFQMEENEPTYKEKHPYFEWIVISIFLIILASGLYLIKPSVTPQKEFNTQPFEFTKVTEKERIKTPEPAPIEMAKSTPQAVQPKTVEAIKETTEITAVPAQPIAIQPARVQYQTIPGDTLWEIAKTHYSGPYFWPVIYQVNINKLTNPDSLEVGITLELPSFNTVFDNLSPDEKPIVAESYYQVYQVYKDLGLANAETYLTVSQTF